MTETPDVPTPPRPRTRVRVLLTLLSALFTAMMVFVVLALLYTGGADRSEAPAPSTESSDATPPKKMKRNGGSETESHEVVVEEGEIPPDVQVGAGVEKDVDVAGASPPGEPPNTGTEPPAPEASPPPSAGGTPADDIGEIVAGDTPPKPKGSGGAPGNVLEENEGYKVVGVFYATDRKRTGAPEPNDMYGGDRGELAYGLARVSIPREHRMGTLEAPSIFRLEFSETPESHVVLLSAVETPVDEFYAQVGARVRASAGRNAFIFVHGYNVSFRDAARRTAQMSYDLGFDGAPAFYSWPSQGSFESYFVDETNVEWTRPHLKQFIREFTERSGADNIFLVAHSMGNRALTTAIKELMSESPQFRAKIREVILAAPDIDADIFRRDIAPFIVTDPTSVTLYASSNDQALKASRRFHGYQRIGDSTGGIPVIKGIDMIDSTDVVTDLIGHAYYAESKSIVTDMFALIRGERTFAKRPYLKEVPEQPDRYWKFIAGTAP